MSRNYGKRIKIQIAEVRCRRIVFSNGSRAEPLPVIDAFGCLRARSALDGVSWAQGG
jgi:hypothetical protein